MCPPSHPTSSHQWWEHSCGSSVPTSCSCRTWTCPSCHPTKLSCNTQGLLVVPQSQHLAVAEPGLVPPVIRPNYLAIPRAFLTLKAYINAQYLSCCPNTLRAYISIGGNFSCSTPQKV